MTKGRIFLLFSTGIIAGGTVVALVMNRIYDSPEIAPQKKASASTDKNDPEETKSEKRIPVESTSLYIDKKLPIRIKGDTASDYYKNIEEDSGVYDSLLKKRNEAEVNINRDQLLESLKVKIHYVTLEKVSAEDSLLNKMNSIKSGNKPATIEVEIWQSPIQYKGYKLGRSKLIVYGIDPDEDILLYDLNDYVLLQSGNQYYRLEKTSDFKNLRKFSDQAVIGRLK